MNRIDKCISEQARCVEYIRENPDGDVRGAMQGLADWTAEEAIERAKRCEKCGEPKHLGLCFNAPDNPEGCLNYEI